MLKKIKVEYREWGWNSLKNIKEAFGVDSFLYDQMFFPRTIRDVKEYLKERRFKEHKPICTCYLEVRKCSDGKYIIECNEYNDNTLLDDTIFSENNIMKITDSLYGKKCTCGQLEKLIIRSNYEKLREEDKKRSEERERQNKEYYDKLYREGKMYHQNEINRLQNLIYQQQRESRQQIQNQNQQHQNEINRMKEENNRREQNYIRERNENNERFKKMENERKQEKKENQERLKTIENERNLEREENKKKFQIIEQERNRERELYTQRMDFLEHNLEEKDEILKQNTRKLEENEKQKLILEKCEKDAEKEFTSNNYQIFDNYYKTKQNLISEEIEKNLLNLIDKNLSFENLNEDLISQIVKIEKFHKNVKELVDERITNLDNAKMNINISSFNIIVLGNTGVGKSTLLNTVLKEKLAKAGFGDACTMGPPKPYESEKAKGIRIWDSRGIENGKYNLENAFNDIKNTIENLIKENDPNKFIHCIWYCIKSNRVTEEESENLKKCYDSYIEKLPIIIVFTRSENQIETDEMMEKVKLKLEKAKRQNGLEGKEENDIKILKLLAENYRSDLGEIKSFGIHNLMEQTYESAKIGIERACIHSLMEQGKNLLKEEFDENLQTLKNKIFQTKNEIIDNQHVNNNILYNILNEDKNRKNNLNVNNIKFDFNNFRNFCKIFSRLIAKTLLLKNQILEEKTTTEIDKVIEDESEKIKNFFEKIFEKNLENMTDELADELEKYVKQLESKYQIKSLCSKYYYNELKKLAKNNIIKNYKPIIEDIIYRKISQIVFKKFGEKIKDELMDCFQELLKIHKGIKKLFTSKGKEISDSCLKKIKNMMDYPDDDYEKRNPKIKIKGKKFKYENLEEDEDD